ncbi:cytochrome P450 [Archangium violaceum]|uniref:cytochrome P450 n=1 Tax=Archangium violaceum TaxID=83451 RepID=UPI0036DCDD40
MEAPAPAPAPELTPLTTITTSKPIPRFPGGFLQGNLSEFRHQRLKLFRDLKETCGEIGTIRLGPVSTHVVTSGSIAHTLLHGHANDVNGGPLVKTFTPLVGERSLVLLHGPQHRKQRKLLAPSFQREQLAHFTQTMVRYTLDAIDGWRDGQTFDVHDEMARLTMRIIGKTLFDVDYRHETTELIGAMGQALEHIEYLTSSLVRIPLSWPTPRNKRVREALHTIDTTFREMIRQRRVDHAQRKDMLSSLVRVRDEEGQPIGEDQLHDDLMTIYSGHESTALSLGWTWYLLARHPEVLARVRQEVDTVLGGRPPAFEDLPHLRYTLQVIKESLRLYPVIFMLARAPTKDLEVAGYRLPKGQMVLMPPYIIHRDEKFFPDPERFDPDRFQPEREKQLPRYAYFPFGAGPHTCIGNHFALMEKQLIVATMVQRLNVTLVDGQELAPEVLTVTLRPSHLKMRVEYRKDTAVSRVA